MVEERNRDFPPIASYGDRYARDHVCSALQSMMTMKRSMMMMKMGFPQAVEVDSDIKMRSRPSRRTLPSPIFSAAPLSASIPQEFLARLKLERKHPLQQFGACTAVFSCATMLRRMQPDAQVRNAVENI